MAVIRVGVQAPAGSAGQTVDLDGPFATVSTIANLSAESIAYSVDGGSSWATIAASGSASPGAAIASDRLRLRKVSSGAYPLAVDVTATLTGEEDNAAALNALVSGDRIPFDGDYIPDPRQNTAIRVNVATASTESDYLPPMQADTRRMVFALASSSSTSGLSAWSGGRSLALLPNASAAGVRWDEPASPLHTITPDALATGVVVTLRGA